ncbi:Serine/threonine-protein phosphatase PP1-1 [Tritrichomonas foetus]|uniref:Serine/threonine-protein phosphatase n=1 Tax=Tritrichomonas foetus TaxID=1144522 RepID=A0A1J4L2E8_9EUKA|nr:Serine/threonine-protein phosphatase PP1-1 [Tritrichomonas foetus]|eukprot:OHT17687.1 Serine/threonine-protein phosphatase PP1-1 [Tritrichomonas foetus]
MNQTDLLSVMEFYKSVIKTDLSDYENNIRQLTLPIVPTQIVINLCNSIAKICQTEPNILHLSSNYIVVGDLHGHILDLLRIFKRFMLPPQQNYIFLGDLVDRGEFSTEVVILIYILKSLFPRNVYVIRGNHEFSQICQRGGFSCELYSVYPDSNVEAAFFRSFAYLPLGAIVGNSQMSYLLVHGGIGPNVHSLSDIESIQRPLTASDDDIANSILWSDPNPHITDFKPSSRGSGYFYGKDALSKFLADNNLKLLVRGHECVQNGIERQIDGMITVFSASYYCGISPNKAGVLLMRNNGKIEEFIMPPLKYLKRDQVCFLGNESDYAFRVSPSFSASMTPPKMKREEIIPKVTLLPNLEARPRGQRIRSSSELNMTTARKKVSSMHCESRVMFDLIDRKKKKDETRMFRNFKNMSSTFH